MDMGKLKSTHRCNIAGVWCVVLCCVVFDDGGERKKERNRNPNVPYWCVIDPSTRRTLIDPYIDEGRINYHGDSMAKLAG